MREEKGMSKKMLELRKMTGLSQVKFGKFYNIPLRTIQGWEEGTRESPEYVMQLLERAILEDLAAGKFKKSPAEG